MLILIYMLLCVRITMRGGGFVTRKKKINASILSHIDIEIYCWRMLLIE